MASTVLGALIWWATPSTFWQAGIQAFIIELTCFGGGLVMSAVKRDRGVKDFGTIIAGPDGVLDRVDSLTLRPRSSSRSPASFTAPEPQMS